MTVFVDVNLDCHWLDQVKEAEDSGFDVPVLTCVVVRKLHCDWSHRTGSAGTGFVDLNLHCDCHWLDQWKEAEDHGFQVTVDACVIS